MKATFRLAIAGCAAALVTSCAAPMPAYSPQTEQTRDTYQACKKEDIYAYFAAKDASGSTLAGLLLGPVVSIATAPEWDHPGYIDKCMAGKGFSRP